MASTYIQEVREQTDEAVGRVYDWIKTPAAAGLAKRAVEEPG
jgi:hypothetical protein